jgi:hypothetical protein
MLGQGAFGELAAMTDGISNINRAGWCTKVKLYPCISGVASYLVVVASVFKSFFDGAEVVEPVEVCGAPKINSVPTSGNFTGKGVKMSFTFSAAARVKMDRSEARTAKEGVEINSPSSVEEGQGKREGFAIGRLHRNHDSERYAGPVSFKGR